MSAAAQIVCKAFLLKADPSKQDALLRYLPEEQQQALAETPTTSYKDVTLGILPVEERVGAIHYSWFTPPLRSLPSNEIRLFLSALSPTQSKGVEKELLFSNELSTLSPVARTFLQKKLWEMVLDKRGEILPIECLPDSSLNPLVELEYPMLLKLIDLLGLHDLAIEVRQIIETAKLKKIQAALSPQEAAFLKILLHRKEPLAFQRMGLQKWDGDRSTLRPLLHQRGLHRLAKALYGKEKSLLWHLCHRLDKERGELLMKFSTPLEHVRAQEILASQVIELLKGISV